MRVQFIATVAEAEAARGEAGTSVSAQRLAELTEELTALFTEGDRDGNGKLDLQEFLELCAAHPRLVHSFETILSTGVERKRAVEVAKLQALFRQPVSPSTRCVTSPSGRRYRPSLFHLRPREEVEALVAQQHQKLVTT